MSDSTAQRIAETPSKEIYLRLLSYVKPHWKVFAAGILGMVMLAATEASIPALLKPVLDGTFVEKDPVWLTWAPISLVALFVFRGFAQILSSAAFASISTHMMHAMRDQMFDRLLRLPASYYEHNVSGNIVSRFNYDVNQISYAGVEVLNALVKDSLIVIGLLAYVFWLDWQLSLLTFILIPTVAAVAKVLGRRQKHLSHALQDGFAEMTHVLEESIRGHKVVKIYGGQEYEASRFKKIAKRLRHQQFKLHVSATIGVPIVEFAGAIIMASAIYIGTARATEEQLTVGGFVAFFTALGLLFSPVKRLTKLTHPLQRGLAASRSVFTLLDELEEVDKGKKQLQNCEGHVSYEQVRFRYTNANEDALGPIDLEIPPNSVTALVGASGSGKTTFVNLLPRLYELSEGKITIDGIDITEVTRASLRQQISFVSQEVILFNDDIAANIAYGTDADMDAIRQAAEDAGALGFIEELPQGFQTQIGENGVRLSGGQRQRLAIARALVADARILILDEATSALDTESEQLVQLGLERLRAGRTTLVIAHRLSTVESADNILVFQKGQIVESGNHDALMQKNGVYHQLNRAQLFTEDD